MFGPANTIPPLDVNSSIAFCPSGMKVVSGGGSIITGFADGLTASMSNDTQTSWFVVGGNNSGSTSGTIQAVAYCAGAGQAVAASSDRAKTRAKVAALVSQMRARREKR